MLSKTTLRPGLLVSLKTKVRGNVSYLRHTIESEHVTPDGSLEAKWETEKRVENAAEHERAKKARADARNAISAVCAFSDFGLLCPLNKETAFRDAVTKAHGIVEAFNKDATLSQISLHVITGTIAADDWQAMSAINAEVLDLLMEMDAGVERKDVKAARDACNRARNLSAMLTDEPTQVLQTAIDRTREACTKIVREDADASGASAEARRTLESSMRWFADASFELKWNTGAAA